MNSVSDLENCPFCQQPVNNCTPECIKLKCEKILNLESEKIELISRDQQLDRLHAYFRHIIYYDYTTLFPLVDPIFLIGPPGTGKTLTITKFLQQLTDLKHQNQLNNIEFRYFNCRKEHSVFLFFVSLLQSFVPDFPDRGFSASELIMLVNELLVQTQTRLLLVLDEIDFFKNDPIVEEFILNQFSKSTNEISIRMHPAKNFNYLSLILITQDESFFNQTHPNKTELIKETAISFTKYSSQDLFSIIKQRVEKSLYPRVLPDSFLKYISINTENYGDANYTIEFLTQLLKEYKFSGLNNLSKYSLTTVTKRIKPFKRENVLDLRYKEKIFLLSIILCFDKSIYNPIFKEYKSYKFVVVDNIRTEFQLVCQLFNIQAGFTNSTLRKNLQWLEKLGIIEIKKKIPNLKGNSLKVFLKVPIEILKELLEPIYVENRME